MIYTVTFNPSIDYIVQIDTFKTGIVNRTKSELIYPGGKGINVSLVLKNLGQKSTALGFIAGFTGRQIKQLLQEQEILTDFIEINAGMSRINVKMKSDEETEINGQGPRINQGALEQLYHKLDSFKTNDILVLAGSIPSSMPDSVYMDILKFLHGRKIRTIVDATGELLMNTLLYHPFLIKPNIHELEDIFHVQINSKNQVIEYAHKLQDMGAENVLVSMGGDGAVFVGEDGTSLAADAPKGAVVNSVGAGDSMVAGFLSGYLEKGNYEYAFFKGICAGSASAFSSELARHEEVCRLMKDTYGISE